MASSGCDYGETTRTGFRELEKRYQLKREQIFRKRNGRQYGAGHRTCPTDFSDVLDLSLLELPDGESRASIDFSSSCPPTGLEDNRNNIPPSMKTAALLAAQHHVFSHTLPQFPGPVFSFRKLPGLYVFLRAVPPGLQGELLDCCLNWFPEPPSHSNHSARHGHLPGLWEAALRDLHLRQSERRVETTGTCGADKPRGLSNSVAWEPGVCYGCGCR
eukprot:CAMPEP_0177608728 /NCGR_PEP_ID=MMETSP0419_2-20121207/18636_1 /TAXON_ID=582737 /ORGANISM="Tetraselmis sp., Strain GSL018" /LENGTH=215 /DNA_ID=CAMNT_0019103457 /DNA_START=96 /DNA_END=740 /DNA_ORIENTATION=+